MTNLQGTFESLMHSYQADSELIDQLWGDIKNYYQTQSRHYHNLQHLEMLLQELTLVKTQIADWDSLLWALFYHDIIYDVQRKDNEERSADFAEIVLTKLNGSKVKIDRCLQHILATKGHHLSNDSDTNFFVDADLSILGQTPAIYENYTKQIRQEYQIFPDELYYPGRQKVVQHFLAMERIFKTDFFFERYEQQARENLLKEK